MKRNYITVHSRLARAIGFELLQKEGKWPAVKEKVRNLLGPDCSSLSELYQLCDVAATAILNCDEVRVTAVRRSCGPKA